MKKQDLQWWESRALPTIKTFRALGALLLLVGGVSFAISFLLFGEKELGALILALFGGMGIYYLFLLPLLLEEGFYRESRLARLFIETHFVYLYRSKVKVNEED